MLFIKKNVKAIAGAFLGVAYVVLLICIFLSIGCSSIKEVKTEKEIINGLNEVVKSGVLNAVTGDSDKVIEKKFGALQTIKDSLQTIKSRAEPTEESSLDKIFNIGVLFIIMIGLLFIYKVFKNV